VCLQVTRLPTRISGVNNWSGAGILAGFPTDVRRFDSDGGGPTLLGLCVRACVLRGLKGLRGGCGQECTAWKQRRYIRM
jgi:hypothetical protein